MRGKFIQIHGTSGAGKTTLMRRIMDDAAETEADLPIPYIVHSWTDKKTQKLKTKTFQLGCYYVLSALHAQTPFLVAGSYSATCGGLDSLSAPGIADTFYPELKKIADAGHTILMEGLIQMSMGRALDLVASGYEVKAFFLSTPLDECLRRIDERRAAAGKGPLENHENTVTKFNDKPRIMKKLQEGGVSCNSVSCDEAFDAIMEMLRAS